MDENNKTVETKRNEMSSEDLKEATRQVLERIRTQSMILGAQAMSSVILQKIEAWRKRLIKDLDAYCTIGISKKVNLDGTTSDKEE